MTFLLIISVNVLATALLNVKCEIFIDPNQ